jgi:ABC-type dipeptide/oligopeptide/nickel transport system ATPase component
VTARAIDRPRGAEVDGQILFDGRPVGRQSGQSLRRYRSEVAMIFQDPRAHINPVRRIGDFMTEALRTTGSVPVREARTRAVDMLGQGGIEDGERRLHQYPHELSGGLLQRVMIATALLTKPRLLLADEPTTALDVTTQAEVMAILDELRREFGLAMLFITHDLELAAAICDRTAVMYAGQIVEIRAPRCCTTTRAPLHSGAAAARPDVTQTAHRLHAIPGRPLSAFEAPRRCVRRPVRLDPDAAAGRAAVAELDGRLSHACGRTSCAGSWPWHRRERAPMPETSGGPVSGVPVSVAARGVRPLVAVDDVSFTVLSLPLAIMGESGSGIRREDDRRPERPTQGTIAACGQDGPGPPGPRGPAPPGLGRSSSGPVHQPDPRQTAEQTIDEVLRLHHDGRRAPPGEDRRAHRPGRARRPAVPGAAAGAVRRAAAAGGDRPGAGRRAPGAYPGRVRGRAGRVNPGAGTEPARRHPGPDRRVLRADQP